MFQRNQIELGTVKVGVPINIEFIYSNSVQLITRILSSCDCSEVHNNIEERKVVVKYTPKPIPPHLKTKGTYNVAKQIQVTLISSDNPGIERTQSLIFTATVVK